ncbi:MAG TPA: glycosyl hydrolase, partial [Puia sp.]|nr:glycosyl hydrolase [Puia sp.]
MKRRGFLMRALAVLGTFAGVRVRGAGNAGAAEPGRGLGIVDGAGIVTGAAPGVVADPLPVVAAAGGSDLYRIFKDPVAVHRPFVRWWWNGDKIERSELARELRLLKEAGFGGVEINPIKFPASTDDRGLPSVRWLSPEWIDLLDFTLKEARSLDLTCDLIVGSGWPFGAEWLQGEERSQIVVIGTHKLEGPLEYEVSAFDLFREADPIVSSPYAGRTVELMAIYLVPDPFNKMEDAKDLSGQIASGVLHVTIPPGKYVLYGLVKIHGSMEVINGAPGANGPVLNHYDEATVKKYLAHMSDTIQQRIGPLTGRVRAFFTDSMELEGANWCADMAQEFKKRRGYELTPYLPFILYKTGSMGNIFDFNYGAKLGPALNDVLERVRYDFDVTKSELIRERFVRPFTEWCKSNKVLSRVQAYGRGYYPLEGSWGIDLPECETWIKPGIGGAMSETDYRVGRAYTMINKFVSSAAHLKGNRHVSCEEMTNTDMVFNDSLEILKIAGDQSILSGVTHPIFHGFNYSPPDAPFPGWVRYGTFFNERNTWWPYLRRFTDYKARLAAILQQGDMFADIAILPPVPDLWSLYGAQNEPFPSLIYPTWQTLVWESIHQNGSACDYVSEQVIRDAEMKDGYLHYGPRKYHTIFLIWIDRMEPAVAKKLSDFVDCGGRVFCIETYPEKSTGLHDSLRRDDELRGWIDKMKAWPERFIFVRKPDSHFLTWYKDLQKQYEIAPYVAIDKPHASVNQIRYQAGDKDWLVLINSSAGARHALTLSFSKELSAGKQLWIWDAETGDRVLLGDAETPVGLELGPADLALLVFEAVADDGVAGLKAGEDRGVKPVAGKTVEPGMTAAGRPWLSSGDGLAGTAVRGP